METGAKAISDSRRHSTLWLILRKSSLQVPGRDKQSSESNWPNCSCDRLVKNQSVPGLHPTHTGVRFGQV